MNFVTHIWHPKRENSDYRATAYAKTQSLMTMAESVNAPGILRMATNGTDVVTQALSCTTMVAPGILDTIADTMKLVGFQRAAILQALCVHTVLEDTGIATGPTPDQRKNWDSLREVLGEITTRPWRAEDLLPGAMYDFVLSDTPIEPGATELLWHQTPAKDL